MMGERQLYYLFHPDTRDQMIPERPSLQGQMTLAMGSALHGVIQTQLRMVGLIKHDDDIEREYINERHWVRGRIDWIAHHPNGMRLVCEMKSRAPHLFRKQVEVEDSWRAQLNLALDAMDENLGVLLMVESGWPYRMAEFHVRRDRELLDSLYSKFDRVRAAIEANEPPQSACCAPDSKEMLRCPARACCWMSKDRNDWPSA